MPVDISVVIPFFNPGPNIDDCLASLVAQTLSHNRYEIILVDDGSTDGSLGRVRDWASRHPDLMKVHHITASGWPGRPRNVGLDRATGRFVQFVDSDDLMAPESLERMLELADSSDADVVVPKMSSDFRGIHQPLFRRTVTGRTIHDYPLAQNLTVAKMFRRDFLIAHQVRFAEGPHHVEDQHICLQAYAHAQSVAVVGDLACYFYRRRRTRGRNLGDTAIVPSEYYRDLEAVIDVATTRISPDAARPILARFYRTEMLGRLRGPAMLAYDPDYRREMVSEVRRLATTRLPADLHDTLPVFIRVQSRLLLENDVRGLVAFAEQLELIRLRATTTAPLWQQGSLVVPIDARLMSGEQPLRLEPDGDGWLLPASIAPNVDPADRRLNPADGDDLDLDLATRSRIDSQLWSTTRGLSLSVDSEGGPRVAGDVVIDPDSLMGGAALTPGIWDLRLRVRFGGLSRSSAVRPASDDAPPDSAWIAADNEATHSVAACWSGGRPALALDVDEWARSLHDIVADAPCAAELSRNRHLVISAPGLRGNAGDTLPATVILTSDDAPHAGTLSASAEIRLGLAGGTIRVELPRLPKPKVQWTVWLRIGPIGAAPARQLPITLSQSRTGSLHLVPDSD